MSQLSPIDAIQATRSVRNVLKDGDNVERHRTQETQEHVTVEVKRHANQSQSLMTITIFHPIIGNTKC